MPIPDPRQIRRIVRRRKIGLRVNSGRIIVRGVNHPVGDIQLDRRRSGAHQVPAPPVKAPVMGLHTLDDNQQLRVHRQNRVPGPLRRQPPISRIGATAPARRSVRFVVQVHPHYRGIALIPCRQHLPIGNPTGLRIRRRIPKLRLPARIRPVPVQDHTQTDLPGIGHNLVHDLQSVQIRQIRILAQIDTVRLAPGVEQLIRVRQPDGVVPQRFHLVHHALVPARP